MVGAAIARTAAAVLGVFGVARGGIFAAAGLGITRTAARFSVFRAEFGVHTLAAVHGGLGVFGVFAAAGHSLGIFSFAASHVGLAGGGRLVLVRLRFMITAATIGFYSGLGGVLRSSGSLRSWRGLLGSQRQPGCERNHQKYS